MWQIKVRWWGQDQWKTLDAPAVGQASVVRYTIRVELEQFVKYLMDMVSSRPHVQCMSLRLCEYSSVCRVYVVLWLASGFCSARSSCSSRTWPARRWVTPLRCRTILTSEELHIEKCSPSIVSASHQPPATTRKLANCTCDLWLLFGRKNCRAASRRLHRILRGETNTVLPSRLWTTAP